MTATRKLIHQLRTRGRMYIDQGLEALILREFAAEPYLCTYTEQDLHEQIRKLVMQYNKQHGIASNGAGPDPVPWLRRSAVPQSPTPEKEGGCL